MKIVRLNVKELRKRTVLILHRRSEYTSVFYRINEFRTLHILEGTMFYHLDGIVDTVENGTAVIDVGGVGYMCNVSLRTEAKLQLLTGKKQKIYTHLSVREDAMELFGFADKSEMSMFKLLISVSGVGARTALAVLGAVSPEKLALAISIGDVKAIKAPGVGQKTAARIVLELKDKLAKESPVSSMGADDGGEPLIIPADKSNKFSEAVSALTALGFTRAETESMLRKTDIVNLSLEDIIRSALRGAGK